MHARISAYAANGAAVALKLLAVVFVFWAAALLMLQCWTWLETGVWQRVPALALFLSARGRLAEVQAVEDILSALDLVPSWSALDSWKALAAAAGNLAFFLRAAGWLLGLPLGLWLVVFALVCMRGASALRSRVGKGAL